MIGSVPVGLAIAVLSFVFAYWAIVAYRSLRQRRVRHGRARHAALEETRP
jgi:uncharacterized protein (DUF2062 family)